VLTHRCCVVENEGNPIAGQRHGLVVFRWNLHSCADFVSMDNRTLVTLQLALGNENSLTIGFPVNQAFVKLALHEAILLRTIHLLSTLD